MHPKWMRNLFLYFSLLGFFPQFKRHPNQEKIDMLIFAIHLIGISIATFFIWMYLTRPVDDTLGTVNDVLKFTVLVGSYFLSIFELYAKRNIQKRFWILFRFIDQHLCNHERFSMAKYLSKMIIYFAVAILCYLVYFQSAVWSANDKYSNFWLSYIYAVLIYQNRLFYYMFFMETVSCELKLIDRELTEMLFYCNSLNSKRVHTKNMFLDKFHRIRFKWIRDYYAIIHQMNGTINSVFGWSNVAAILLSFHLLLTEINWFYWKLLNKYEFSIIRNLSKKYSKYDNQHKQ